jgi:hypothetical protein
MYGKIKANTMLVYPYGYDELQLDNLHTKFTGNINLVSIFANTNECIVNGCSLVEIIEKKPFMDVNTRTYYSSNTTPFLYNGQWITVSE